MVALVVGSEMRRHKKREGEKQDSFHGRTAGVKVYLSGCRGVKNGCADLVKTAQYCHPESAIRRNAEEGPNVSVSSRCGRAAPSIGRTRRILIKSMLIYAHRKVPLSSA